MQQEVCMALECGHLSCLQCHTQMHSVNIKKIDEVEDAEENPILIDGYACPFCKIFSSKFIRIYI
jgi:hypothetical protein